MKRLPARGKTSDTIIKLMSLLRLVLEYQENVENTRNWFLLGWISKGNDATTCYKMVRFGSSIELTFCVIDKCRLADIITELLPENN